jgi:hypothetical protein
MKGSGTSVSSPIISRAWSAALHETPDDPAPGFIGQKSHSSVASRREKPFLRTIGTPIWLAIVVLLSLLTNAIALVVAASNPRLEGPVTAVLVALLILVIAVAVTVAFAVVHKRSGPTNNGNWVYW